MQFSTILALVAGASASALLPRQTEHKVISISELRVESYAKSGALIYHLKAYDGIYTADCALNVGNSPRDDTSCHNSPEINGFSERLCDNDDFAWSLTQQNNGDYLLEVVNIEDNGTTRLQGVRTLPAYQFQCLEGPEENYVKSFGGDKEFSLTLSRVSA